MDAIEENWRMELLVGSYEQDMQDWTSDYEEGDPPEWYNRQFRSPCIRCGFMYSKHRWSGCEQCSPYPVERIPRDLRLDPDVANKDHALVSCMHELVDRIDAGISIPQFQAVKCYDRIHLKMRYDFKNCHVNHQKKRFGPIYCAPGGFTVEQVKKLANDIVPDWRDWCIEKDNRIDTYEILLYREAEVVRDGGQLRTEQQLIGSLIPPTSPNISVLRFLNRMAGVNSGVERRKLMYDVDLTEACKNKSI
jgi:hypothetical protein